MLSAQSKQTSTAALERSRPQSSHHRRCLSESASVGGRGIEGGGGGGGASAGRRHAAHSLMTLARVQQKRSPASKVCMYAIFLYRNPETIGSGCYIISVGAMRPSVVLLAVNFQICSLRDSSFTAFHLHKKDCPILKVGFF